MCSIFTAIEPKDYAFQTRSVRLGGHATSVRLEAMFWSTLEEIACVQKVTLGRFLSMLNDEVLQADADEPHNFASLLRCACLTYIAEVRGKPDALERLRISAHADFGRRGALPALRVASMRR